MFADIIQEALAGYDNWFCDDDFDAVGAFGRVMERMRERFSLYSRSHDADDRLSEAKECLETRDEPSSPPEDELSKLSGGWEPIETAPREEAFEILASTTGRVWFQCSWDEEEQRWITFNRYLERDPHLSPAAKAFEPKWWIALPQDHPPVRGREGSVFGQTNVEPNCADAQARRSGGDS